MVMPYIAAAGMHGDGSERSELTADAGQPPLFLQRHGGSSLN